MIVKLDKRLLADLANKYGVPYIDEPGGIRIKGENLTEAEFNILSAPTTLKPLTYVQKTLSINTNLDNDAYEGTLPYAC